MAIWQLTTFLVPKEWWQENPTIESLHGSSGYFESSKIWSKFQPDTCIRKIFESTLGETGTLHWESKNGSDYDIDENENGSIDSVRIRIDARVYSEGELKRILALVGISECVLYVPEFSSVIESSANSLNILNQFVSRSKAVEWCRRNPT